MVLLLRRAPDAQSDRYDVICGRETIGTIFKHPGYIPWHWSIWRYYLGEVPHGTSASREEAMRDLAELFRKWLASQNIREPGKDEPFDVPMERYEHGSRAWRRPSPS